jgi:predicted nucleotidyltransferase
MVIVDQATEYPEINALLGEVLAGVQAILGQNFVGMYLYGSLAMGDFSPSSSDIDFLVVTQEELTDEAFQALKEMHARIAAGESKWARELECSYIPLDALRRYDARRACHAHLDVNEGCLKIEQHDTDWVIQRFVLREYGLTLAGPAIHTLIDPISSDELRRATVTLLRGWWAIMLKDPTRLQSQAYRSYAILTMCRMLYTFQYGTIVSKPVAARWSMEHLESRWAELVRQAIGWPEEVLPDNVGEVQEFIRYTLGKALEHESVKD